MPFKIATFNVNSIRSRLHIVIPWLKENKPDVFCMQETKVDDRNFPEADFHHIGYHVVFSGSRGRNGVATASLKKPTYVESGFNNSVDRDRLIRTDFKNLTVVNTYVPQGFRVNSPKYQYKLEWFNRLKRYFEENLDLGGNIVWCGDMNVAPQDIDVHNPKKLKNHVCFHEDVRKAFEKVKALGFVDIFRKHHPEPGHYTFFDYRVKNAVERGLGWRVDHILATKPMAEKSKDCYIDLRPRLQEKPSDHTILVAEFDLEF